MSAPEADPAVPIELRARLGQIIERARPADRWRWSRVYAGGAYRWEGPPREGLYAHSGVVVTAGDIARWHEHDRIFERLAAYIAAQTKSVHHATQDDLSPELLRAALMVAMGVTP